ncbi:hypothetical protein GCM10009646_45460 [Streptomyces aureus]
MHASCPRPQRPHKGVPAWRTATYHWVDAWGAETHAKARRDWLPRRAFGQTSVQVYRSDIRRGQYTRTGQNILTGGAT